MFNNVYSCILLIYIIYNIISNTLIPFYSWLLSYGSWKNPKLTWSPDLSFSVKNLSSSILSHFPLPTADVLALLWILIFSGTKLNWISDSESCSRVWCYLLRFSLNDLFSDWTSIAADSLSQPLGDHGGIFLYFPSRMMIGNSSLIVVFLIRSSLNIKYLFTDKFQFT